MQHSRLLPWFAPAMLIVASCRTPEARNTTQFAPQWHDARDLLAPVEPGETRRMTPAELVTLVTMATAGDEWDTLGYDIKVDASGYLVVSASAGMNAFVAKILHDVRTAPGLPR